MPASADNFVRVRGGTLLRPFSPDQKVALEDKYRPTQTVQTIIKFTNDHDRKTISSSKKAIFEIGEENLGAKLLFRPGSRFLSLMDHEGDHEQIAVRKGDLTFEWSGCIPGLGQNTDPKYNVIQKLLPEGKLTGGVTVFRKWFEQPRISTPPPTLSGTDYKNEEEYLTALRRSLPSDYSKALPAYMNFETKRNKWEVSTNCEVSTPFTISLVKQGRNCPESYLNTEDGFVRFDEDSEVFIGGDSKVLPITLELDATYYIVTDYHKRSECRLEMHLLEAEASKADSEPDILPVMDTTNLGIITASKNTGTKDTMASMLWTLGSFLGLIIAF